MKTVGDIIKVFEEAFPEAKDLLTVRMAAFLCKEAITAEEANHPKSDTIRIMRLYVFEGPRAEVERQIERSLGDGTKVFSPKGAKIHVATIGSFPEILQKVTEGKDGHTISSEGYNARPPQAVCNCNRRPAEPHDPRCNAFVRGSDR